MQPQQVRDARSKEQTSSRKPKAKKTALQDSMEENKSAQEPKLEGPKLPRAQKEKLQAAIAEHGPLIINQIIAKQ